MLITLSLIILRYMIGGNDAVIARLHIHFHHHFRRGMGAKAHPRRMHMRFQ